MTACSRSTTISAWVLLLRCASAVACGGDGDVDGSDPQGPTATPGTVTLLVEVRPDDYCQMSEVVRFTLQATRIGCEPGPPAPCTLPAEPEVLEGDVATCPVTDPVRTLGVDVTEAGRYRVEVVSQTTTGQSVTSCYGGSAGATEIAVTQGDLDGGATIEAGTADELCRS